jgi:hypothetical protein
MVIAVVRVTVRDDIDLDDFGKLEEKMLALGRPVPKLGRSETSMIPGC